MPNVSDCNRCGADLRTTEERLEDLEADHVEADARRNECAEELSALDAEVEAIEVEYDHTLQQLETENGYGGQEGEAEHAYEEEQPDGYGPGDDEDVDVVDDYDDYDDGGYDDGY